MQRVWLWARANALQLAPPVGSLVLVHRNLWVGPERVDGLQGSEGAGHMSAVVNRVMVMTFLMLAFSLPTAAQTVWDVAAERITRLAPSTFVDLPPGASAALEDDGCTIPQAWGDNEPHNVVAGEFGAPGQTDWAVLCSKDGSSSIVVVWGGPVSCPSPIASPLADQSFLQNTGLDGILFSRGVSGIRADPRYWNFPDGLESLTHAAISDAFYEKGATAYYCERGVWLELTTGD